MYTVIARRYRPQGFDEVVGQEHIAETLKNAIKENRIAHAYLFVGPRGVGKTSMARIFAKALNCVNGPTATPCGKCESCRMITEGSDVDVMEIDGASNRGIDNIRTLRENVLYAPVRGKFKIYIVDEFHMLTTEAFNAFLKTLEEPPEKVKFVFATTEAQKMPDTIVSRCQRFDFRRISNSAIARTLGKICAAEDITSDEEALFALAKMAKGSLRDAESALDQLISHGGGKLTARGIEEMFNLPSHKLMSRATECVRRKDLAGAAALVDTVFTEGYDPMVFVEMMMEHLRNLMLASCCQASEGVLDLPQSEMELVMEQSRFFSVTDILCMMEYLAETRRRLKESNNPKILLEMAMMRMANSHGSCAEAPKPKEAQPFRNVPTAASQPDKVTVDPPPPPVKQDEKVDLAGKWLKVLEEIGEKNKRLVACAKEARPRIEGDSFLLEFPRVMVFHKDQFEDEEKRQTVEKAVAAVFHRKYKIVAVLDPASPTAAQVKGEKTVKAKEAQTDPGLNKILTAFGGTVIRTEDKQNG